MVNRSKRRLLWISLVAVLGIWAANTSHLVRISDAPPKLLAHRGVHQTFAGAERSLRGCSANPVEPITHGFIENTLPSMQAAFAAGADVVELDIYQTPDAVFAVFHDYTLDCRTNGTGRTDKTLWRDLQSLDVGHGYSADGVTFPLRGTGLGMMPRLEEVYAAFPKGRFLVNLKGGPPQAGRDLADWLQTNDPDLSQTFAIYGHPPPTQAALASSPDLQGFDKTSVKACLIQYLAVGWSGHVPTACRSTIIAVPDRFAPFLWGWPARFQKRMDRVGTDVILTKRKNGFTEGFDTLQAARAVPKGFTGYVWTNRAEVLGPSWPP